MKWYIKVMGHWFDFKGRASRQEYWMFILFNVIFGFIAEIVDGFLGIILIHTEGRNIGPVALVYALAALLPSLAVAVRRLHDTGKSGWWLFAPFVAMVAGFIAVGITIAFLGENFMALFFILINLVAAGAIVWGIVLLATPGQQLTNKWGPPPAEIAAPKVL